MPGEVDKVLDDLREQAEREKKEQEP